MGQIKDFFDYLSKLFTWWVIVQPWEQGLRIRMGKQVTILKAGIHFKMPIVDIIYIIGNRPRVVNLKQQTLTTLDGETLTLSISMKYSVEDISKLYKSYFAIDHTIAAIAMSSVAKFISSHKMSECLPSAVQDSIKYPDAQATGLKDISINIINYARVKTYRLIGDGNEGYFDSVTLSRESSKSIVF